MFERWLTVNIFPFKHTSALTVRITIDVGMKFFLIVLNLFQVEVIDVLLLLNWTS